MRLIALIVGVFLCLWSAGEGNAQGPGRGIAKYLPRDCQGEDAVMDVTAARMTFDQRTGSFVFEENVHIRQCGLTIRCDRVRVTRDQAGEDIRHIVATGNVSVEQGTRHLVAKRAEYFATEQRLVLTGDPRVWDTQDSHEMSGDEIVLLLPQDHIMVPGARVLFHPNQKPSMKAP